MSPAPCSVKNVKFSYSEIVEVRIIIAVFVGTCCCIIGTVNWSCGIRKYIEVSELWFLFSNGLSCTVIVDWAVIFWVNHSGGCLQVSSVNKFLNN